jgi:hypothetical protein
MTHRHRHPDPGQRLFPFIWSDESDDRDDDLVVDTDPPLADRVEVLRRRWSRGSKKWPRDVTRSMIYPNASRDDRVA